MGARMIGKLETMLSRKLDLQDEPLHHPRKKEGLPVSLIAPLNFNRIGRWLCQRSERSGQGKQSLVSQTCLPGFGYRILTAVDAKRGVPSRLLGVRFLVTRSRGRSVISSSTPQLIRGRAGDPDASASPRRRSRWDHRAANTRRCRTIPTVGGCVRCSLALRGFGMPEHTGSNITG